MLYRVKDPAKSTSSKPVIQNAYLFMEGVFYAHNRTHYRSFYALPKNQVRFGSGPKMGPKNTNGTFWTPEVLGMPSINGVTGHAQKRKMKNFGA